MAYSKWQTNRLVLNNLANLHQERQAALLLVLLLLLLILAG